MNRKKGGKAENIKFIKNVNGICKMAKCESMVIP